MSTATNCRIPALLSPAHADTAFYRGCPLITPLDFLADLFNPSLAFLPRALAAVLLASVVTGVVGCHVMMRGMVFIGDAVAHSVFPGLAVAFVLGGNLMVGGLTAGVVTAILVAIFSQNQRLREDSVIGIFFAASFALGIVIISLAPGYSGSVQDFLFGSIVGVSNEDITNAAIMGAVILLVLWLFHRQIVTVSLDRESARAMGLPVLALDIVLYVLVTISVVLGLQTLGNVLVLALLVIPASAARLACRRLGSMMVFSPVFGGICSIVGLYLSWAFNLPTGGTIVLSMVAAFVLVWAVTAVRSRARAQLKN